MSAGRKVQKIMVWLGGGLGYLGKEKILSRSITSHVRGRLLSLIYIKGLRPALESYSERTNRSGVPKSDLAPKDGSGGKCRPV